MIPLALVGMSYREAPSAVRAALAAVDTATSGPSKQLLNDPAVRRAYLGL